MARIPVIRSMQLICVDKRPANGDPLPWSPAIEWRLVLKAEIANIFRMLGETQLLTVTGAGGVGKTRTALGGR
jgi:hypothetical protein